MNLPKFVRFNNPHVLIAAAFYMQAKYQFDISSNIKINLGLDYLLGEPETVMGIGGKVVQYQSLNWNDYNDAPLAKNLKEFIDLIADKAIKIENNTVEFHKGSIKVGCTKVENEKVREIVARLID